MKFLCFATLVSHVFCHELEITTTEQPDTTTIPPETMTETEFCVKLIDGLIYEVKAHPDQDELSKYSEKVLQLVRILIGLVGMAKLSIFHQVCYHFETENSAEEYEEVCKDTKDSIKKIHKSIEIPKPSGSGICCDILSYC